MFDPRRTDILTLEYIRKSMSSVQLEAAEAGGMFDLLKSGGLHPQKVLVHGKHGPYYATRMVANDSADAPANMPRKAEEESGKSRSAAHFAEEYAGRSMRDVYAGEGKKGVANALAGRYFEEWHDRPFYDPDRLENFYGHSDLYTPEAAARAMRIWTDEKLQIPETEGMDEEELEMWREELRDPFEGYRDDGTVWGCTLMRQMDGKPINPDSESEITAAVCAEILESVIESKGAAYGENLYRGVVMPEGTIEDLTNGYPVDLGSIASFTTSGDVARRFLENSPVWGATEYEDSVPESIVFVIEGDQGVKSYKVEQSGFGNEKEHLVPGKEPYEVTRIAVDAPDGLNLFDDLDEDEYDPFDDHVYYVYLGGKKREG